MQSLHEYNKQVLVTGDFNIDVTEAMLTTNSIIVNDFHNMFLSCHLCTRINKPTKI